MLLKIEVNLVGCNAESLDKSVSTL